MEFLLSLCCFMSYPVLGILTVKNYKGFLSLTYL